MATFTLDRLREKARWLAALCVACLLMPLAASAHDVDSIVVKVRDDLLLPGAEVMPAAVFAAVKSAAGHPLAAAGRTRDGAFILTLSTPVDLDAARAALNRIRMDAVILYAGLAPGAPVPATEGPPTDRIIVKYKDGAMAARARVGLPLDANRVENLGALAGVPLAWARGGVDGSNVMQMLQRRPIAEVEAIAARIAQQPDVDYAQPDYIRTTQLQPTDPCYASAGAPACIDGYQWDLFDPIGGINMPAAWDITTGSPTINIAVVDTGILSGHPDLAGRVVGGYDMIADCAVANDGQPVPCTWSSKQPALTSRDSDVADPGDWVSAAEDAGSRSAPPYDWFAGCGARGSSWHGTHVAGTIGAAPGNGIGIAGINWISKIVPMRALGKCGGYASDIAAAIAWAAGGSVAGLPANANPARVVNLSVGGPGSCDPMSQNAINSALALGAVVVVAAGNENDSAAKYSPASCSGVIAVAATTKTGARARYSNYGSIVDIAAPGGNADGVDPDILSTLNSGTTSPDPLGYMYARYAGTSMATPHVSGVASLMLSVNPTLTPAQVQSKIQSTARAFPAPGPACNATPQASACNCTVALCGSGILDAAAAVAAAITSAQVPTVATGSASVITATSASVQGTVSSNGAATTVTFEYGLTTSYGSTAEASQSPLSAGASGAAVSAALSGLACNALYHYRAVAVNSAGPAAGLDATFMTSACSVLAPGSTPIASATNASPTIVATMPVTCPSSGRVQVSGSGESAALSANPGTAFIGLAYSIARDSVATDNTNVVQSSALAVFDGDANRDFLNVQRVDSCSPGTTSTYRLTAYRTTADTSAGSFLWNGRLTVTAPLSAPGAGFAAGVTPIGSAANATPTIVASLSATCPSSGAVLVAGSGESAALSSNTGTAFIGLAFSIARDSLATDDGNVVQSSALARFGGDANRDFLNAQRVDSCVPGTTSTYRLTAYRTTADTGTGSFVWNGRLTASEPLSSSSAGTIGGAINIGSAVNATPTIVTSLPITCPASGVTLVAGSGESTAMSSNPGAAFVGLAYSIARDSVATDNGNVAQSSALAVFDGDTNRDFLNVQRIDTCTPGASAMYRLTAYRTTADTSAASYLWNARLTARALP